jgi:hypothetical protein
VVRGQGAVWIVLGAVMLRTVDAYACSWSWGADLIAPTGDQHPANAAVVLIGAGLGPEQLSATIDGIAATLVVDETVAEHHIYSLADHYVIMPLRLDPVPEVGQQVAITGDPCGVDVDCSPIAIMYTATAADTTISDATPTLSFNLARFSRTTGNTCASWGSLVQATVTLDEAAFDEEELVLYEVVARNGAAKISAATHRQLSWLQLGPYVLFDEVGDAFPLDGWCVDVSMIDVAGNRGTVTTSCMPALCDDGASIPDIGRIPFEPIRGGSCSTRGLGRIRALPPRRPALPRSIPRPPRAAALAEPTTTIRGAPGCSSPFALRRVVAGAASSAARAGVPLDRGSRNPGIARSLTRRR